jgi:hypothetical protein
MCRGTQRSPGTKTAKKNTRKIVRQKIVLKKDSSEKDRSEKDHSAKDWLLQDRSSKGSVRGPHGTNRLFQCSGG